MKMRAPRRWPASEKSGAAVTEGAKKGERATLNGEMSGQTARKSSMAPMTNPKTMPNHASARRPPDEKEEARSARAMSDVGVELGGAGQGPGTGEAGAGDEGQDGGGEERAGGVSVLDEESLEAAPERGAGPS